MSFLATPDHNSGYVETPRTDRGGIDLMKDIPTASASKRHSCWDKTPSQMTPSATFNSPTPKIGVTPSGASMIPTLGDTTPGATPMIPMVPHTPVLLNSTAYQLDILPWV